MAGIWAGLISFQGSVLFCLLKGCYSGPLTSIMRSHVTFACGDN